MAKKKTFRRTELSHVVKPTKSDSNLPAQITNQCDVADCLATETYAYIMRFVNDNRLPIELRLLIDLLLSSGCRISELLAPQGFIVRKNGLIELYASKNKVKHVFRSANFDSYLMNFAGSYYRGLSNYSRFQIYRLFKKLGIYATFENNTKMSVTHLPRHVVGSLTYQSTNDMADVKHVLNHKSINSSEYYVKKIKK